MSPTPLTIGLTMGDPSGIGPEIIAKALPVITRLGKIVIIGDNWVFNRACRTVRVPHEVSYDFVEMANVRRRNFSWGKVKREYGAASLEYVDYAHTLLTKGFIDCMVTCPVSKEAVSAAHKGFCGHTEYLAKKAGVSRTVMLLLNRYLTLGLVTTHIPLRCVARRLTERAIKETILMTATTLTQWFGIARPSLFVAGLNPHASDNGVIGTEEERIIAPAIKEVNAKGFNVQGPFAADSCCAKAMAKECDAVIAMYHDQALIPLKSTDPSGGVNLTCGLPYVRTSPLHGTAFDIAGKNTASAASLVAATETAYRCATFLKNASAKIS